ncbi:MAG TPA: SDR family oxidoreductase [Cyclobacteriaceae bacterium]
MAFALVTGSSGGIGLCIAKELASRKYDLLLVARSESKLKSIQEEIQSQYKVTVQYLVCDLSQPDASKKVIEWVTPFDIQILVNNAGFGIWGNLEQNKPVDLHQLIQLNQVVLMELCKGFVPTLKNRSGKSYILNIGSTAAYQAVPGMAVYSASKAFVVSFTRALRWELKDTNISVTCFSPGTTTTGFMDRALMDDAMKQKAEKVTMTPEEVARIGVVGMLAGKAEVIPGFINWISVKMVSFVPKFLTETIAYNLYKQK